MPQYNIENVLVGLAWLYFAPGNTAYVDDATQFGMVDTVDPWAYIGATEEGVNESSERDLNRHVIEEQSSPAYITVNSTTVSVSASLAEYTLENLKLGHGAGTIETTAATTTTPGKKRFRFSDQLDELAIILEGKNPEGFYRRYYIPRVLSVGSVETAHRRSESKKLIPVQFESISDISEVFIDEMTSEPVPA